jgi:hypothetical protein
VAATWRAGAAGRGGVFPFRDGARKQVHCRASPQAYMQCLWLHQNTHGSVGILAKPNNEVVTDTVCGLVDILVKPIDEADKIAIIS